MIEDKRVSRNSAQIRSVDQQFYIVDLNSTGGTFVNEQKITQTMLFSGDTISLAGYSMTFVLDSGKLVSRSGEYTTPFKIDKEETYRHKKTGLRD